MTTDDAVPLEIDAPAPCDRIERPQRSDGHPAPRILVTFGSVRGSTFEIAAAVAGALRERGFTVDCLRGSAVRDVAAYDAVIVGGALYAGRWAREARRVVTRYTAVLRTRPVWLFSSGPLDDTARHAQLPMATSVASLAARIGARGHSTFGGRLAPDAKGLIASAIAKQRAGGWRSWPQIHDWALEIAHALETAPRIVTPPAVAPARWPLAALCLAVGATAIAGGAALVISPDGSLLHAPRTLLAHTPFPSFLLPGLLLLLMVGASNALAGARLVRDLPGAYPTAFVAGGALLVWIVTEMILLRSIHWLQLGYLVVALAIVFASLRLGARRETAAGKAHPAA